MAGSAPAAKHPRTALAGPYGHPLHPALVALPIGAWVASFVLDLLSKIVDDAAAAAHAAWWLLGLGVLGAVVAAAAGLLDLLGIPRGTRAFRFGLTHMSVNLVATLLFAVSWVVRRPDVAPADGTSAGLLVLSLIALLALSAGGYLGGELAYRYGVRVADEATQAEGFTAVITGDGTAPPPGRRFLPRMR